MQSSDFDVIVVGAGLAGLASATTAAEAGASVLVLEKMPAVGGSTVMSGGFFALTGTEEQRERSIGDSPDLLLKDLVQASGENPDMDLLRTYVAEQPALDQWLRSLGAEFLTVELSAEQSVARSHHTKIKSLVANLSSRLSASGLATMYCGSRATELLTDESGAVEGITYEYDGASCRARAHGGVVLATGGFSRSIELLRIFAPRQTHAIPYGGLGSTGDGLKMAWRLGAGLRDMGYISSTYGSHPQTTIEQHELLCAYYLGAIIVNSDGKRFVDESVSYKILGEACIDQPTGLGVQVFDSTIRAKSKPGIPLYDIDALERKGRIVTADSLKELALLLDLPLDPFTQTVDSYNSAARGNGDDVFGRTGLCNGVGALVELGKPPFYAYTARPLMTTTFGGVATNSSAQVVTVFGDPIIGLYAAGEIAGGFHGRAYMTGTSLGKAAIFGRIAGIAAAARARKDSHDHQAQLSTN